MAKEIKVDYEDVFGSIKWDLDKAQCLLADLQAYFDSPDLDYPTRDKIDAIRGEYKHIAVIAGLLGDLVAKLEDTISPLL
jgi:hypothetical protein